jgi:hypothetical protein
VVMSHVLSREKREQVIALGRLGPLFGDGGLSVPEKSPDGIYCNLHK